MITGGLDMITGGLDFLQVLVFHLSSAVAAIGLTHSILRPDPELGEGGGCGRGAIPVGVTNAVAIVVVVVVAHHRVSETEHGRSEASHRG